MTIAEHIAALRDLSARGEIEWEKIPTVTFDASGNVGNMRLLIDVCGEARPAVVVERARFERLLDVAQAAHYKRHTDAGEGAEMLAVALGSLESGDLKLPD